MFINKEKNKVANKVRLNLPLGCLFLFKAGLASRQALLRPKKEQAGFSSWQSRKGKALPLNASPKKKEKANLPQLAGK